MRATREIGADPRPVAAAAPAVDAAANGHGAVAQLGERRPCKAEVVGSSPISSTIRRGVCEAGFFK